MAEYAIESFAGINNTSDADRISAGWTLRDPRFQAAPEHAELVTATNVDIDDTRKLLSRSGVVTQIYGAYTSLWAEDDIALAVMAGTLYRIWPDYTTTAITTGVGANVCYCKVADRVYWSDGESATGVVDAGNGRSWGLAVPVITGITLTAGTLQAGDYKVAITAVRSDMQESGAGPAVLVTATDNGGFTVEWGAQADVGVSYVNIYVSDQNSTTLYFVGQAAASALSYTYTGGALGRPLDTQWLAPPSPCFKMTDFRGRMYTAVGEYIFASTVFGYELFDVMDYHPIDGSRITMLAALDDVIYVGTDKGLYYLKGNTFDDFVLETVKLVGVVPGSEVFADGFDVTGKADFSGKTVVIFTTTSGIMLGADGGDVVDVSGPRYAIDAGVKACAVFRNDTEKHQYVVFNQQEAT